MNKSQRKHSPAFKAKVALEAIKNELTLSEIASKYSIHPRQIQTWRKQLLDNAGLAFDNNHEKSLKTWESEKSRLYAQIGELKVERDFLEQGFKRLK